MTPTELRAEIESGPLAATLAPLVAAGSDAGAAGLLNARVYPGPVPIAELSGYCARHGITGAVMALLEIPVGSEIATGVAMTLQIKGLLHTVLTLIQLDFRLETADVNDPAFGAGLVAMRQLGVMNSDQAAAILALRDNRLSRAEIAFGRGVAASDVAAAFGRV